MSPKKDLEVNLTCENKFSDKSVEQNYKQKEEKRTAFRSSFLFTRKREFVGFKLIFISETDKGTIYYN